MTTKLNNSLREEIVDNVINATDLPALERDIRRRVVETVRQTIIDAQPAGFYDLIKHAPKEWFRLEASVYIYTGDGTGHPFVALVKRIGRGIDSNVTRVQLDDPIAVAQNGWEVSGAQWRTVLADLYVEANAFVERYNDLYREISAFLKSVTTVEKLLERMPELERHVPKVSKPLPLVAPSNLLSSLSQLGFDRTLQAA